MCVCVGRLVCGFCSLDRIQQDNKLGGSASNHWSDLIDNFQHDHIISDQHKKEVTRQEV